MRWGETLCLIKILDDNFIWSKPTYGMQIKGKLRSKILEKKCCQLRHCMAGDCFTSSDTFVASMEISISLLDIEDWHSFNRHRQLNLSNHWYKIKQFLWCSFVTYLKHLCPAEIIKVSSWNNLIYNQITQGKNYSKLQASSICWGWAPIWPEGKIFTTSQAKALENSIISSMLQLVKATSWFFTHRLSYEQYH